jgi:hypothetical protein
VEIKIDDLSGSEIAELNLRWKRRGRAILGDGSEWIFNIYEVSEVVKVVLFK